MTQVVIQVNDVSVAFQDNSLDSWLRSWENVKRHYLSLYRNCRTLRNDQNRSNSPRPLFH